MEENFEESYTSVNSYTHPLKSLTASQLKVVENNDWTVDNDKKDLYYSTEFFIVKAVISHAETITTIAQNNRGTDSEIYKEWMNKFLSFYDIHESRVLKYLKNNPLEKKDINKGFIEEMEFQQKITGEWSKIRVKVDKLKNLSREDKDEVVLRWKGNVSIPITMAEVIFHKHPKIKEALDNKLKKYKHE